MKFKGYTVNEQHRGMLPLHQKSQWRVDEWEELRLFFLAYKNEWICNKNHLWSLSESFSVLGEDSKGELNLAKYWSDHQNVWHGFPVSPKRTGDRPPSEVLKDWMQKGFVKKREASKIAEGKF